MTKLTYFSLIMISSCLVLACSSPKKKLEGTWGKVSYSLNEIGLFRADTIKFEADRFVLISSYYESMNDLSPLFSTKDHGSWIFEGRNKFDSDLNNLKFIFDKKYVKIQTTEKRAVEAFFLNLCSAPLNQYSDISNSGCSIFPPIQDLPAVYQIIKIESNLDQTSFYLGRQSLLEPSSSAILRPMELESIVFNKLSY